MNKFDKIIDKIINDETSFGNFKYNEIKAVKEAMKTFANIVAEEQKSICADELYSTDNIDTVLNAPTITFK